MHITMAKRPRQSLRSGSVEKLTQSDFAVELTPQAMNAQYRGKRMAAYLEEVIVATYLCVARHFTKYLANRGFRLIDW